MPDSLSRREALQALGAGAFLFAGAPVRIHPAEDGTFTVYTGKVELGQGARTELTQCAAEELRVPIERIRLVMGDTAVCPDDGGTYSSLTTPLTVPEMRQAAAGQRGGSVTPPADWKVLGSEVRNVRGREIATGAYRYPSDLHVDGMLYGCVVRAPYYRASLLSSALTATPALRRRPQVSSALDREQGPADSGSAAVPAEGEVVRDGDFIAVLARDPEVAAQRAAAIRAQWKPQAFPVNPSDHQALSAWFQANSTPPTEQPGAKYPPLTRRGDAAKALDSADHKRTFRCWLPYIAHTPMEPRAALAIWKDGSVEIHTGTQTPFPVRAEVAKALDVPESRVRIVAVNPGGGFGGKHRAECEIEAARLARIAGKPVKVAWSREEEFTGSYHRPAGLVEIESALGAHGKLDAWVHRNYNSGAPALPTPYDTPNISCEFHRTPAPVRQGPYRSLAAVANIFARESHMDDWAAAAKIDPWDFRMNNLADARLRAVLEKLGKGPGGMACTIEKDARIALRAEVAIEGQAIRLKRFTYVGEYGAILNPLNLRNQITGALIMGIGGALFEEVRFDKTTQRTRRLSDYRVPRFGDMPEIEVHLIDRRDLPSAGAGESAIAMTAPAIANAVFAATGHRFTSLPFRIS